MAATKKLVMFAVFRNVADTFELFPSKLPSFLFTLKVREIGKSKNTHAEGTSWRRFTLHRV